MNTPQHATYRTLVQRLHSSGKLGAEGVATLTTMEMQLGLSREHALAIEREVMGQSKEDVLVSRVGSAVMTPPGGTPISATPGQATPSAFAGTFSGGQTGIGAPAHLDAHDSHASGQAATPLLNPGEVVAGRFEVQALLGEGGMGQVLKVMDRKLGAVRAMKVIRPALVQRDDIIARFRQEVLTCQKLSHPHIVRVFDYDEDNVRGLRFFTMEFVEGLTLRQFLQQRRAARTPVTLAEFDTLARGVCEALAHAHTATVHRDLKPENVMVDPATLTPKLMDFGIAKVFGVRNAYVTAGPVGTAYYMAPELESGGAVDARADIYSAGLLFYEILAGEMPRAGSKLLSDLRPDVPATASRAIAKAMSINPAERFSTMTEFRDALLRLKPGPVDGRGPEVLDSVNQFGAAAGKGIKQFADKLIDAGANLGTKLSTGWGAAPAEPPAPLGHRVIYTFSWLFVPFGIAVCWQLWKRECEQRRAAGQPLRGYGRFALAAVAEHDPWPHRSALLRKVNHGIIYLVIVFWAFILVGIAVAIAEEL